MLRLLYVAQESSRICSTLEYQLCMHEGLINVEKQGQYSSEGKIDVLRETWTTAKEQFSTSTTAIEKVKLKLKPLKIGKSSPPDKSATHWTYA